MSQTDLELAQEKIIASLKIELDELKRTREEKIEKIKASDESAGKVEKRIAALEKSFDIKFTKLNDHLIKLVEIIQGEPKPNLNVPPKKEEIKLDDGIIRLPIEG